MKHTRAFTLIELICVTSVIMVLAALLLSSVIRAHYYCKRKAQMIQQFNYARIIAATKYDETNLLDPMLTNTVPKVKDRPR